MFTLTRRALNEAWSGRTAKIGRPVKTLPDAIALARRQECSVTITDTDTGLSGIVRGKVTHVNGPTKGRDMVHFEFPREWDDKMTISY